MNPRHAAQTTATTPRLSLGQASRALVFVALATSGVVFAEPAPVDALMMGLIVLLPLAGLVRITPALVLHLMLWLVVGVGALVASTLSTDIARSAIHTGVSFYLYAAMFVLAAFVAADPLRHATLVLNGLLAGALVAAIAALIGYFGLVPGTQDMLTKFGRAAGTFKDPNVLGPFLVPAILYAVHMVLSRPLSSSLPALVAAPVLTLALLLSFSRGAWFNLAVALLVFGYLTMLAARSPGERMRLGAIGSLAVLALIGVVIAALQVEAIATLMEQRSSLTQGYDVGPEGRFGGQAKAFALALANPFGIGATQFAALYHHEDVHNVYLSMLLNAGWLGGLAYAGAVGIAVAVGLAHMLKATATRPLFFIAFAALIGNVLEGFVIDTDHWRHFYMLLALVLGLIAGEQSSRRA